MKLHGLGLAGGLRGTTSLRKAQGKRKHPLFLQTITLIHLI